MSVRTVRSYRFSRSDEVVLDTNVLVFVFAASYNIEPDHTRRGSPYTKAYNELLVRRAQIILLDVVLAEFFGVMEAMASRHWYKVGGGRNLIPVEEWQERKQSRRKGPYPTLLKEFRQATADILKHARFEKVALDETSIGQVLADVEAKRIGINDVLIARHCETSGRVLLTSDADMLQFQDRIDIVHGA